MLPLLLALLLETPPPASAAATVFGRPVEIEVRDLSEETARSVIQKALSEMADVERLTNAGVAALNAASGGGAQPVDPRLLALLSRAGDFCFWSEGAHGPLGRDLYALWALPEPPAPERLQQAVSLAACGRLALDPQKGTATLAEGGGLDLSGFAEGYAIDRAVEILRREGAGNGFVRIGAIQRGFGPGPAGKGWPAALPGVPGLQEAAGLVYLRDRALAVASPTVEVPYVNQRTGQPARGVLVTAAVTDLALDAGGLAAALLIAGPREGQLRMGSLRPRPSVLWLLGSGTGAPLQVGYRWSEVNRK